MNMSKTQLSFACVIVSLVQGTVALETVAGGVQYSVVCSSCLISGLGVTIIL